MHNVYIRRSTPIDTIHRTTGIGHHVNRNMNCIAVFHINGQEILAHATEIVAGEKLIVGDMHTYRVSSVVSYALETGEDPVYAIDRARERGHDLVWIISRGAMLTAECREPEPYIRVYHGMPVLFQGVIYRLDPAPNRNLKLMPYVPSLANAELA